MIPLDQRAPFIQQRWVELYNAGAYDIPGFGVCEITGSSRPENINNAQAGGRTVLSVTRPTEDSPAAVCINGPMPIAAGAYGFGTLDYPAYALYDDANTPAAGDTWGAASGTFELTKDKAGFVILGDAANGLVRIDRAPAGATPGIPFRNDSGETAPAYAVMRVTGTAEIDGTVYITIGKPNNTFNRKYLVNTGSDVAAGDFGSGTWLNDSEYVLYDQGDGTPSGENEWGAWPGQWSLRKGRLGFTMVYGDGAGVGVGIQREIVSVFGKLYEDLEQGGEADFRVWMKYDGQHRDTQMMLTVHDWYMNRDEEMKRDTKAEVAWYSGEWRIRNAYCSEDDTDDAPGAALALAGTDGSGFFVSVGESPAFDLNDLLLETG